MKNFTHEPNQLHLSWVELSHSTIPSSVASQLRVENENCVPLSVSDWELDVSFVDLDNADLLGELLSVRESVLELSESFRQVRSHEVVSHCCVLHSVDLDLSD